MKDQKGVSHLESDFRAVQKKYNQWVKNNTDDGDRRSDYIPFLDSVEASLSEKKIHKGQVLEIEARLRARADELGIPSPDPSQLILNSITGHPQKPKKRDLPKRLQDVIQLGVEVKSMTPDQLVDGKYIDAELLKSNIAESGKKAVLLCAGLGVGKSTAAAKMMLSSDNRCGMAITHRVKLTHQLCDTFDAERYDDVKEADGGYTPERIGTTIHSLDKVLGLELSNHSINNGLVLIDEIESVANELNQSATLSSPHKAVAALAKVASSSRTVIGADAHISTQSVALLVQMGFELADILLVNIERPEFAGRNVEVFRQDDGLGNSSFAALTTEAKKLLDQGRKVTVVGLSRTKLEQLKEQLKDITPQSIMVTSQISDSVVRQLTAETYQNFDLVVLSPSMSTGISFDGDKSYNHADTVLVHAANNGGTGSPFDALQALFRDRNPGSIKIYYDSVDEPLSDASRIATYAKNRFNLIDEIVSENNDLKVRREKHLPNDESVRSFLLCNQIRQAEDKINFFNILLDELNYKGAYVSALSTAEPEKDDVTQEMLQATKEEIRREVVCSIANAIELTVETDTPDLDDQELRPAKKRAYIESETGISFESLSEPDKIVLIDAVMPEHGPGIMNKVRDIERTYSDPAKVRAIVDASLGGVSCFDEDTNRFMESDFSNHKIYWRDRNKYIPMLLKAIGVEGKPGSMKTTSEVVIISDSMIRKRSNPAYGLARSLKAKPYPAIRSGVINQAVEPEQVKANTAKYIVEMLERMLGLKARKKRSQKSWTVDTSGIDQILLIANNRVTSGTNSVESYYEKIQEWKDGSERRQRRAEDKAFNTIHNPHGSTKDRIKSVLRAFDKVSMLDATIAHFRQTPYTYELIRNGTMTDQNLGVRISKFLDQKTSNPSAKKQEPG